VAQFTPDAIAESVALAIKSAISPILERLASMEARLAPLTDVRDRVMAVEIKAAQPRETDHDMQGLTLRLAALESKALPDASERLAAAEQANRELQARVVELSSVRDRVTTLEAKAAPGLSTAEVELMLRDRVEPMTASLSAVSQQHVNLLTRVNELDSVRERLTTIETKSAPIVTPPTVPSAAELELSIRNRIEPVATQVATLSERIAVLEVRAPVPGSPGRDGADGKDGADGLGFDDMEEVIEDGGRIVKRRYIKGDRVKEYVHKTAAQVNRGVYVEGKSYELGDVVTWGGSQWHCNEPTTTRPGDGLKAWTLVVKRGRDGKDGRDAVTVPVVSVGRS
jgi:hypothetical protein